MGSGLCGEQRWKLPSRDGSPLGLCEDWMMNIEGEGLQEEGMVVATGEAGSASLCSCIGCFRGGREYYSEGRSRRRSPSYGR